MLAMRIQLAYTPNADDAYMLFGLTHGHLDTQGLEIEYVEASVPALNDQASTGQYEVTMISASVYALIHNRYALLSSGASFARDLGPLIVAREPLSPDDLAEKIIAIPGATTTAYAILQLYSPLIRTRVLPFDKLLPAVQAGLADAALVIHEEFTTYQNLGLSVVMNLAQWWSQTFEQLPMPVSCAAVRRDVPVDIQHRLAALLSESVRYAHTHHEKALAHAMTYAPDANESDVARFIAGFVNDLTEEMGAEGRSALETLFQKTAQAGMAPTPLPLDLITPTA